MGMQEMQEILEENDESDDPDGRAELETLQQKLRFEDFVMFSVASIGLKAHQNSANVHAHRPIGEAGEKKTTDGSTKTYAAAMIRRRLNHLLQKANESINF